MEVNPLSRRWKQWYNRILFSLMDLNKKNIFMICKEWIDEDKARNQEDRVKRYCRDLQEIGLIDGGETEQPSTHERAKFEYSLDLDKFIDYWYCYNKRLFLIKEPLEESSKEKLKKIFSTRYIEMIILFVKIKRSDKDDNIFLLLTNTFNFIAQYDARNCKPEQLKEWLIKLQNKILKEYEVDEEQKQKLFDIFNPPKDKPFESGLIMKEAVDVFKENFSFSITKFLDS
jgi:predicted transcriptional regulator